MNATSTQPKRAYTVAQFCQEFSVSKSSFYRMIKDGELKTKKRGHRTLIRAEDAEAWLDSLPDGAGS